MRASTHCSCRSRPPSSIFPRSAAARRAAQRLRNGNPAEDGSRPRAAYGDTAWASCRGTPVAIGTYRAGMLSPSRVFRP